MKQVGELHSELLVQGEAIIKGLSQESILLVEDQVAHKGQLFVSVELGEFGESEGRKVGGQKAKLADCPLRIKFGVEEAGEEEKLRRGVRFYCRVEHLEELTEQRMSRIQIHGGQKLVGIQRMSWKRVVNPPSHKEVKDLDRV